MRQADIQQGAFYIGGNMKRIREVTKVHEISVDWRDIDPETLRNIPLATETGSCSPKTFAAWAKHRVEPEEVRARLAMPRAERVQMSQGI
jgi:hypothetical protein